MYTYMYMYKLYVKNDKIEEPNRKANYGKETRTHQEMR